jgi:hypothetical protein
MSLKKLQLKAGINRENTRYTNEGGWYECDKIRFRQGLPEKIGGWQRISDATFLGVCRSLWNWVTLGSQNLIAVGTNLKYYIENGGAYNDITPIRATEILTNPFETTIGSPIVEVTDANGGYIDGDFVTFSNATAVGGLTLNAEYQLSETTTTNVYTIDAGANASSSATGGGTVTAVYQINIGPAFAIPLVGWGASSWGVGAWGIGNSSSSSLRIWSQANFGEDLIFAPRDGPIYFWDATTGIQTRGVLLTGTDIPATNWSPSSTNQAGDIILSNGTEIVAAQQARQEVLVWTDSALYALQYVGAPAVWTAQSVGENTSIASQNAVGWANGVAYWMGRDKFYMYDGRTQPLKCDLRRFIFNDFNTLQYEQVFCGTNESYHEIWWWYCSSDSSVANKYVVYNYVEKVWYYGNMSRTAWLDSGLRDFPLGATYSNNLVNHEEGVDDNEGEITAPIAAYISSAQFDLEDGHQFAFIWRILPDITFDGSEVGSPSATMTLLPLQSSGSGYNNPASVGGTNNAGITRSAVLPVEQFTDQLFIRVRGRQLAIKVESSEIGVTWQLGSPRIDMRSDGRR